MRLACFLLLLLFATGCTKQPAENEILDGPVDGLSGEQSARFLAGDRAFNDDVFTKETGLGPLFVSTSCGSCHAGDGKGHPFATLTRFGQNDATGNQFLDLGGPQLQNRALPGFLPEQIPTGATSSKFLAPANTGLGFLELVSDADLLAMADPSDADGDGVSGVVHWKTIPAYLPDLPGALEQNGQYICRFGKKAGAYSLLHQTVNAYNQDMGINSLYEPIDVYSGLEVDPEVTTQKLNDVVFYLQTLKAPLPRNTGDADVLAGKLLFVSIGCEKCHRETLNTGVSPVAALSNKQFHPYTDLLLHDMGSGLDDGYTEGSALTSEWRTPALWGVGLSPNSQGGQYFLLHDGRATSLHMAVELHGGEAEGSKQKYVQLSEMERKQLLKFLESL